MSTITEYVKSGKKLVDILNTMLTEECMFEKVKAKHDLDAGELEERLDDIERNYDFNKEKFDYVDRISTMGFTIQNKFLTVLMYIDSCDLSTYNQVTTILTLASMFNKYGERLAEDFDTKDLYFFATVMVSIPLEQYGTYGYIISRNITRIMNKTNDEEQQRNICYAIFDYCDLFIKEDAKKEEMDMHLDDIVELINNYKVNEKRKSGKI